MGKLDDLQRTLGSHVDQSMGEGITLGQAPPGLSVATAQQIPERLKGVTKARDAVLVPVEKIDRDPDQPRQEFDTDALQRLAQSLKTKGQLQPIRVRWDEEAQVYRVLVGERRWRAARIASMPTLTCIVHEGPIDPSELLALQLVENALREDLKPVEQARAYKKLMDSHGWSGNQLAKELSIDQSTVVRALSLLELPSAVQDRVERGELAPRTAYEIGRLERPEDQVALAEQVVAQGMTRDEVAAAVQARKPARSGSKGKAVARKVTSRKFRGDGFTLTVENRKGIEVSALESFLRSVIEKVRIEVEAEQGGVAPGLDPEQGRAA